MVLPDNYHEKQDFDHAIEKFESFDKLPDKIKNPIIERFAAQSKEKVEPARDEK